MKTAEAPVFPLDVRLCSGRGNIVFLLFLFCARATEAATIERHVEDEEEEDERACVHIGA